MEEIRELVKSGALESTETANANGYANTETRPRLNPNPNVNKPGAYNARPKNKITRTPAEKMAYLRKKYGDEMINLVLLCRNNSEIRRFTSYGIINFLYQKGEIKEPKGYVTFFWNKFSVKCAGLNREFSYTEAFFINCLVASFTSFATSATKIIETFCKKEMMISLKKVKNDELIEEMIEVGEKVIENSEHHEVEDTTAVADE